MSALKTIAGVALLAFSAGQSGAQLVPFFIQQGPKLVASSTGMLTNVGQAVALSADGNTALVGGTVLGDGAAHGTAFVFTRSGAVWTQQAQLDGTGTTVSVDFGTAVALSADGNTALVGDYYDNNGTGAVWVFSRSNGAWSQQGTKLVVAESASLGLWIALSADGNTALFGGSSVNNSTGAAWVFTRSNGNWSGPVQLDVPDASTNSQVGSSVALSGDGNIALLGGRNDNNGVGAAWFFTRSGGVWAEQQKVAGVASGAISADGNVALLCGGATVACASYIQYNGRWSRESSNFGGGSASLSSTGNLVAFGCLGGCGAVYVRDYHRWRPLQTLVGSGANGNALQDSAVALSADGSTAIEGGPMDGGDGGAAWVFVRPPTIYRAPIVTSIAPNSGPAAGGTSVTITGSNFRLEAAPLAALQPQSHKVIFGSTPAASYTVNSATSITATSPAGTGTADVTVTTAGGTSATSAADQFTYQSGPGAVSGGGTSTIRWRRVLIDR
jgi:hypothetical protein